jgi:acyl carrier protein
VGTGYWRNAELTAETFVENPFGPGLMYRTGDLAYRLPDGVPVYVGRRDFQVKLRGLRIELGEIEVALRETTGMSDWLVLASSDTLIAYVRTDGPAPSSADLRDRLASRLPDYMIPRAIVAVTSWPLSPNGKVDREALGRMRPSGDSRLSSPPRTDTERRLARTWQELIGRPDIGREESFFSIGGHSLLAARAVARIRSEFGIELPLRIFFEVPTIAAMGSHIDGLLAVSEPDDDPELLKALSGLSEQELDRLLVDEN